MRSSRKSRQYGIQRRKQLAAKHCLGRSDTRSGIDGCVLPEKKTALAALQRAHGVLQIRAFFQLSDTAFGLIIRGAVIVSRCKSLDIIPFVECSDLVGHESCAVLQHHPPWYAKCCKELTQYTDDHCRSRMINLPTFQSLAGRVYSDQEGAAFPLSVEVNM